MTSIRNDSTLGDTILNYEKYKDNLLFSGLDDDPLAVQILKNIDNLTDIINNSEIPDKKNKKYFSRDPLYNSLEKSRKIPASYLCTNQRMDITNYLRSGIADFYLKDRGGLSEDDFHYYTYLPERTRRAHLTKENYELIYAYYKLIKSKCKDLEDISEGDFHKGYSFEMDNLYIISKPKALEIGYELLKDASIKYKFSLNVLKKIPAIDIIKSCINNEYLLGLKHIKRSIEYMKNKKIKILEKVKRDFNGSGSIWKFICSSDTLYLEELRFIADINGIPDTGMLTKQDLCSELEKLSIGNKAKTLASCQNETDISGDDIKDIPAEYFFAYEENGKSYCTDIRSAYSNIKSGNNKNPYTNLEIPEKTRNKIVELYEADIKPEEQSRPTLTQLLADFSSKIPYLNSVELYKNATKEQLRKFYDTIVAEIPSYGKKEVDNLYKGTLEEDKYIIINSLLIDDHFEYFKYYIRSIYNEIFSVNYTDTPSRSSSSSRPSRPSSSSSSSLTIEEMLEVISSELNPDGYINATRYEVYEFIETVSFQESNMAEDLGDEYDDDSVSDEEFKHSALSYLYNVIFGHGIIDEDYREDVIDTYKQMFNNSVSSSREESPIYEQTNPEYEETNPEYEETNPEYSRYL